MRWAPLVFLSPTAARRRCSDLLKKFDPGEGVRPPGLYDLDVSVERRQPIEESVQDGRSVWRGLQQHAPRCHNLTALHKEKISACWCWMLATQTCTYKNMRKNVYFVEFWRGFTHRLYNPQCV